MKPGPLGFGEVLLILVMLGLPLWAIFVAATRQRLSLGARVLLIGVANFAPVVGPLGVLIAAPLLAKRQAV